MTVTLLLIDSDFISDRDLISNCDHIIDHELISDRDPDPDRDPDRDPDPDFDRYRDRDHDFVQEELELSLYPLQIKTEMEFLNDEYRYINSTVRYVFR